MSLDSLFLDQFSIGYAHQYSTMIDIYFYSVSGSGYGGHMYHAIQI